MKKSERLIFLLELLNQQGSMELSDIVSKCGISARTVYRDLKSLSELGFPVQFDNGYKLGQTTAHPVFSKFSEDELRLISFALETHPMAVQLPFNRLSRRLRESMSAERVTRGADSEESIFLTDESVSYPTMTAFERIIPQYLQAIDEKKLVSIQVRDSEQAVRYIPIAIQTNSRELSFVVSELNMTCALRISIADVKRLDLLSEQYNRRPVQLLAAGANLARPVEMT